LQEGECGGVNPLSLGDVIISADAAAREAEEGAMTFFERLSYLLLHGILHLNGFDHERSGEAEELKMELKEQQLFRILKKEGLLSPPGL
jgi:probable rRNA maturation factor